MQAQADPRLTEVATAGPWAVFFVADSISSSASPPPVVVDGVQGGGEGGRPDHRWQAENVPLIAERARPVAEHLGP